MASSLLSTRLIRPAIALLPFPCTILTFCTPVLAEAPQIGLVTEMTVGDRACYVTVQAEPGLVTTELADFDICEQDLIGKQVAFSYDLVNVLAASCEGDLECGLTETVRLITDAQVVQAESSPNTMPNFLNEAERGQLREAVTTYRNNWFGLAGLNKVTHPPALSPELLAYRQAWKRRDPAIAPFLGLWHNEDYDNNRYHISIFPSIIPQHACVLEFKPTWSIGPTDIVSAGIFSVSLAKASAAQLISPEVRASELAIAQTEFGISENYPVQLLPLVTEQQESRVVAAADLPRLPASLTADLQQITRASLTQNGCSLDVE